jgi:nitrogen fixation protein NifX
MEEAFPAETVGGEGRVFPVSAEVWIRKPIEWRTNVMKIAFASSDGTTVDLNFGQADTFQVWEIRQDCAMPCGKVNAITSHLVRDERNTARVAAIAGCSIVCSVDAGTKVLAKIMARNIFHLRTGTEAPISEIVAKIQCVLRNAPPPWMKKIVGPQPECRDA